MKRYTKNKRGVALEMAISTLMIVFALCTLMLTVTYAARKQVSDANTTFVQRATADNIGEAFVMYSKDSRNNPVDFQSRTEYFDAGQWRVTVVETEDGNYHMTVYTIEDHIKLVSVIVDSEGNVLLWSR